MDADCTGCIVGKFKRMTRGKSDTTHAPLSAFAVDLTGPVTPQTMGGCQYLMGIYDMGSGYGFVEFLKQKSQALERLKDTMTRVARLRTSHGRIVIRIDGGELNSMQFKEYCRNQGYDV